MGCLYGFLEKERMIVTLVFKDGNVRSFAGVNYFATEDEKDEGT